MPPFRSAAPGRYARPRGPECPRAEGAAGETRLFGVREPISGTKRPLRSKRARTSPAVGTPGERGEDGEDGPVTEGSTTPPPRKSGGLEQRRLDRVPCRYLARFEVLSSGATGNARLVNLGANGARVDLPLEVTRPDSVKLVLEPPIPGDPSEAPLEVEGAVVWTVLGGENGVYPTGLHFKTMTPGQARRLAAIVAHLMPVPR